MSDEDLTRRLSEALRAKAAQARDTQTPFEEAEGKVELGPSERPPRHAWRAALVAAVVVGVVAAGTTAVVATRSDDNGKAPLVALPTTTTNGGSTSTIAPATTTTAGAATTTTTAAGASAVLPWGRPTDRADGTAPVDAFNALLDSYRPVWATSARRVATEFAQLDPQHAEPPTASTVTEYVDASGREHVVMTATNLPDDSVRALRYDVTVERRADQTWRLTAAAWMQQCQPNRGHQDFSAELCI